MTSDDGTTREGLGARLLRYWGFACAVFVGLNLLAIPIREGRLLDDEPQLEPHVDAGLRAAYPELREPERRRLVWESFSRFEAEAIAQQRESPRRGAYVNVSEHGFREVADQGPWPPTATHYNVFFFGGSTGFGYGVRDEDTVASRLQQALGSREGRPVRVYNFAHGGFNSVQERLALERLVALGYVPDSAVFLDGMNDFQAGSQALLLTKAATRTLEKGLRAPLRSWFESLPAVRAIPPSFWGRESLFQGLGAAAPALSPAAKRRRYDDLKRHEAVIDAYLANQRATLARTAGLGIEALFVWQPVPTYGYDLTQHAFQGNFGAHSYAGFGYPRMAQRVRGSGLRTGRSDGLGKHDPLDEPSELAETFVWCADLQRGVAEPLYVDTVHYNPSLSKRVAGCIRDAIVDGVRPRPVVGR